MARGKAVEGLKEEFKVLKITTLGLAEDKTAKEMLEETAWQVQPIMTKRQWKVGLLTEMPIHVMDRAGDNYNRGQKVRLKLRRQDGSFEPYEHVLLVMLHELCHNEFGPHSASFYKLLDEIQAECEELMAKGIGGMGSGFDAPGVKLGHRGGWGVTPKDALAAAAAAAEKRAKYQSVMGGGGKTGGSGSWKDLPPAEAARRAAERREAAERFARQNGLEDDAHSGSDEGDYDAPSRDANRRQTGAAAGPSKPAQQQQPQLPPRSAAAAAAAARAGDGGAAGAGAGPAGIGGGSAAGGVSGAGRGLSRTGLLSLRGGKACVCGACGPEQPSCKEESGGDVIVLDDDGDPPPARSAGGGGKGTAPAAAAAAAPAALAAARRGKGKAPAQPEPEVIDLLSSDDEDGAGAGAAGGAQSGGGVAAKRKQQPQGPHGSGGGSGKRSREERGAAGSAAGAGTVEFGPGFWTCRRCTLAENRTADSNCQGCGEWRYSTAQLAPPKSRLAG